jgi:hypothetical protein
MIKKMKRKIDSNRIYKLVRVIVVVVSVMATLIGVVSIVNFNKYMDTMDGYSHSQCSGNVDCDIYYINLMGDYEKTTYCSILIGLGLPIIFFGGKALINYIAPVVKKQNEKDKKIKKN